MAHGMSLMLMPAVEQQSTSAVSADLLMKHISPAVSHSSVLEQPIGQLHRQRLRLLQQPSAPKLLHPSSWKGTRGIIKAVRWGKGAPSM